MSKAKSLGFSAERLARIDHFLQDKYVGPGRMPCAQFVLARKGQVVHESVLGMRDVERATPLTGKPQRLGLAHAHPLTLPGHLPLPSARSQG